MQSEPNEKGQDTEETFSFLTETIKPKTKSRKKLLRQLVRMVIYGLVIGVFACCSFFALKPWAERVFGEEFDKVTIPEDEMFLRGKGTGGTTTQGQQFTEESYQKMMNTLYLTAQEAKKSIVSVRIKKDAEWTKEQRQKESAACAAGIIAADNGQELLILTDQSVCHSGTEWEILFSDGSSVPAVLKVQDKNRGLAVFRVLYGDVSENTRRRTKTAEFGNSNLVAQGDIVIGIGSLFGYEEGLGYGIASSVEYHEIFADGQCGVIATDIAVAQSGTGVLIDQSGKVIGLIRQGLFGENGSEYPEVTANALGISDLKSEMELMLNGKNVPYAGIRGVTVTKDVAEEQAIPEGLYVTEVESDSPAMASGIQNGDVIQEVNGETVTGISSFENVMLDCAVGDLVKVQGKRRGSSGYVDTEFTLSIGIKK
mgnify:FL=1